MAGLPHDREAIALRLKKGYSCGRGELVDHGQALLRSDRVKALPLTRSCGSDSRLGEEGHTGAGAALQSRCAEQTS